MGDKPSTGPIVINAPTSDDDGGSSSGGSSGPSAPPMDTYVSDQFKQDAVKRTKMQQFAQLYQQLWGEPATEDYLAKAVNAGLNTWEFAEMERNKPAFSKTGTYKSKGQGYADVLASLGAI